MKKIRLLPCIINELNAEGEGKTEHNGKPLLVSGMYPGEEGTVRVIKKKRSYLKAIPEEITTPSKHRIEPQESHYTSCSPWQTIPYPYQIELKKQMLTQAFQEQASEPISITNFYEAPQQWQYRTKVEFSFWYVDSHLHIAFHERGKPFIKVPLPDGCKLASDATNQAALAIEKLLNTHKIDKHDLKTLIIRESKTKDERIAILCTTKQDFVLPFSLSDIPGINGLIVAYSSPLSPISRIDAILKTEGQDYLEETIDGISLRYPIDSFFQNNIPLFETSLKLMQDVVKSFSKENAEKPTVVELYSGVGTIGLALCKYAKTVRGVELVPSSIAYALENATRNKITNYICEASPAEALGAKPIHGADILILDPPRTGLHEDVIAAINEVKPKTILYLSCNPVTLARDYNLLKHMYSVNSLYGFDFYPQTPHMEALLTLERIQ